MVNKKKVFIIAGEDSGDILAAGLMRELNNMYSNHSPLEGESKSDSDWVGGNINVCKKSPHQIRLRSSNLSSLTPPQGGSDFSISYFGIGGKLMKEQGLKKSFFPMKELSVMGLDIVPQIPHFLKRINETVNEIIKTNPDVVITVDAPEFSFRVLKKLRKTQKRRFFIEKIKSKTVILNPKTVILNPKTVILNLFQDLNDNSNRFRNKFGMTKQEKSNDYIKLVHYVSPSVWAWREGRAKKISKFLDAILLLWPFEKKYYPKLETFYVGHSAITRFKSCREIKSNTMMCLPGSRRKEVEGLLPIFVQVINNLYSKDKSIKVKIPVAENVYSLVKDYAKELQCKYELITDAEEKNKLNGKIALCASGTAVFEVALREIPIVSAYKMGKVAGFIGKLVLKSKWVTLPNIIMNKAILPELLQKDCTVEKIQAEVEKLLYNEKSIAKQRKSFVAMRKKLQAGEISPDIEAAKAIKKVLFYK